MGEWTELTAKDGHAFSAYRADPPETPRAGIIIVQEIFGITAHIRRVTEQFAELGFLAVAPCLFDRVQPNTILDYSEVERGRKIMLPGFTAVCRSPDLPVAGSRTKRKARTRSVLLLDRPGFMRLLGSNS